MSFFLRKINTYRHTQKTSDKDVIDIKFPSELQDKSSREILLFIIDDDPAFIHLLTMHFAKLELKSTKGERYRFKTRGYTAENPGVKDLYMNPDLIILNYFIKANGESKNGAEILNEIKDVNPNQKVITLNTLDIKLRDVYQEHGMRDYLINDKSEGLEELNKIVLNILS